jgi:hypothetical protein
MQAGLVGVIAWANECKSIQLMCSLRSHTLLIVIVIDVIVMIIICSGSDKHGWTDALDVFDVCNTIILNLGTRQPSPPFN